MKYIITASFLLALIVWGAFSVSAAATTKTKVSVSGETKIKTAAQLKVEKEKKAKVMTRAATVKKLERYERKAKKLSEFIKTTELNAVTLEKTHYKKYLTSMKMIGIYKKNLQKQEDVIAMYKSEIAAIDLWISQN
jgi:hypothetical protein